MADLEETLDWAAGVYQIEQTDPVVGGPPDLALGQGIANVQAQQLADRTGWLKAAITALQGVAVSQADIDTAIAALLDGAPAALDTLNELATALGDNDSELAAIISQLAGKMSGANNLSEITDPAAARANIGAGAGVPIGMIFGFHGTVAPAGWITLDGTPVTALYPELRTHLLAQPGVTVDGNGDPFLVDMRGEFLRGLDAGREIDVGRVLGSWQADELREHDHDYVHQSGVYFEHGGTGTSLQAEITSQTGLTGGNETRPRNIAVLWCIKAADTALTAGMADLAQLLTSIADQVTAEAGIDNTKLMTALRTKQAILEQVSPSLGDGQTWQEPVRVGGTVYQNTTGRTITVISRFGVVGASQTIQVSVDNITWVVVASGGGVELISNSVQIPDGNYYQITSSARWVELR